MGKEARIGALLGEPHLCRLLEQLLLAHLDTSKGN